MDQQTGDISTFTKGHALVLPVCSTITEVRPHLTNDTHMSLKQLGDVLHSIHERMRIEGYTIKDNKITKL